MIKLLLGLSLAILVAVITLRTAMFPDHQHKVVPCSPDEGIDYIKLSEDHLARFQRAIQLQTVSYSVHSTNTTALQLMVKHIESSYPSLHSSPHVTRELYNYSSLYVIEGTQPDIQPVLLTGHIDVVPALVEKWSFPPFSGDIDNGMIYGRGTLDNKNTVFGILEALEHFIRQGKRLKRSLYFAIGHDEEVMGLYGATAIAQVLKERGLRFSFMLDEGLVVLKPGMFPGYAGPVGLIGVAEKGYATMQLSVDHIGGHALSPPLDGGAIVILSEAMSRIHNNPFPLMFGKGVEITMFEHAAQSLSLPYRILSSNLWLFGPVLGWAFSQKDVQRAQVTTTMAFTMINGGIKENVLPNHAQVTINARVLPVHTCEDVFQHVVKVVNDARVKVTMLNKFEASKISSTNSEGYNVVHHTIKQIFPESIVLPMLLMGATDTRWYSVLTDDIYRFAPSYLAPEDIKRIHGHDEFITVDNYEKTINFYYHLINNLEKSFLVKLKDEL